MFEDLIGHRSDEHEILRDCGERFSTTLVGHGICARPLPTAPVVLAAIVVGLAGERWLVGPAVARLAASYVSLSLAPSATAVAVTAAGLIAGAAVTVLWATRLVTRGPVVAWLRES